MQELAELKKNITIALGNESFTLDTTGQSFIVYPTNYINLVIENVSICLGTIIYGNITLYNEVLDNVKSVVDSCNSFEGEWLSIHVIDQETAHYRVCIEDRDQDIEDHDFSTIKELLTFINTFD